MELLGAYGQRGEIFTGGSSAQCSVEGPEIIGGVAAGVLRIHREPSGSPFSARACHLDLSPGNLLVRRIRSSAAGKA